MLKKRIGTAAIEKDWPDSNVCLSDYFKLPTSLIIPEGCARIGLYAFWGCNEIEAVYIPKSIRSIGWHAFLRCNNLKNIICEEEVITTVFNCRLDLDDFKSTKVSVISDTAMKNIQKVNTLTNRKV